MYKRNSGLVLNSKFISLNKARDKLKKLFPKSATTLILTLQAHSPKANFNCFALRTPTLKVNVLELRPKPNC